MKDRKRYLSGIVLLTAVVLLAFSVSAGEMQETALDGAYEDDWISDSCVDAAKSEDTVFGLSESSDGQDLFADDSVLESDGVDGWITDGETAEDEMQWDKESITEADGDWLIFDDDGDIPELITENISEFIEGEIAEESTEGLTEEVAEDSDVLGYPAYETDESWFSTYGKIDTSQFTLIYSKNSGKKTDPYIKIVCPKSDSSSATFFTFYNYSSPTAFTIPDQDNMDLTEWEKYKQYILDVRYLNIGGSGEQSYFGPVASIGVGKQAFTYMHNLEKVYFPLPVTGTLTIGEEAFAGLLKLKIVDFMQVKSVIIKSKAFDGTDLREITLPEDAIIESKAFANLKKRTKEEPLKVYFRGDPANIAEDAFAESTVKVYVYPKYREWVEEHEGIFDFYGHVLWDYFATDQVCGNNLYWTLDEETGVLTVDGTGSMYDYTSSIPAPWDKNKSMIQEIIIGPGVSYVGDYAFYSCTGCKKITLGENTLAVGNYAFSGCTGCEEIMLGTNTQTVGNYAFNNCASCRKIVLGDNTQTIGNRAFYKCKNCTDIYLGSSVSSIGEYAFYDIGNWERLDFPDTLTELGSMAFYSSVNSGTKPLLQITFRGTVPSGGGSAFSNRQVVMVVPLADEAWKKKSTATSWCGATVKAWLDTSYTDFCGDNAKWIIEDGVMTISGLGAIQRGWTDEQSAGVREIHIEDGITQIREATFSGFSNLETIYITDDIKNSSSGAFGGCYSKLTRIVATKGTEEIDRSYYVIQEPAGTYFLLYPRKLDAEEGSIEYHIPDGVSYVDVNLFREDRTIKTVSIPEMTSLTCYAEIPDDMYYPTFLCYTDSAAQIFCEYNNLPYQLIDEGTIPADTGWRLEQIAFSFSNSREDFEYDQDYAIPLGQYQSVFGDKGDNDLAHVLQQSHSRWGGNCFGMSAAALLSRQWIRSANSPFGNIKNVSDLGIYSLNQSSNLTVRSMIEQMQVMQYSEQIQDSYYVHMNDMAGLRTEAERLKDPKSPGTPILIAISGPHPATGKTTDHVVVGYYLASQGSTKSCLYVYDSNYPAPNGKRYITLFKNSEGDYTGWSYNIYGNQKWGSDVKGGRISYVTYDTLVDIWLKRGSLKNKKSLIKINSSDFTLKDAEGNVVASVTGGKLSTNRSDIYLAMLMEDIEKEDQYTYIYVPADEDYTAQSTGTQSGRLEVTIVNTYGSVTIMTEGNTVTLGADDVSEHYVGSVDAAAGEAYRISINGEITSSGIFKDDIPESSDTDPSGGEPSGQETPAASSAPQEKPGASAISAPAASAADSSDSSSVSAGVDSSGSSDTSEAGSPCIRVNTRKIPLKKGQTTKKLIVSMAEGDRIVSVTSNKAKIVKASVVDAAGGRVKLSGKKVGKAVVTIKLASGLSTTVTVSVQSKMVKTSRITLGSDSSQIPVNAKTIRMKKGEQISLGAAVVPFTSQEKLKYMSSDRKVVTVNKKGLVTAKKTGKTRIIVQSGSKRKAVMVIVE